MLYSNPYCQVNFIYMMMSHIASLPQGDSLSTQDTTSSVFRSLIYITPTQQKQQQPLTGGNGRNIRKRCVNGIDTIQC